MDYVEGRLFWDPTLPGLAPAERAAIYDAMNETAASLHRVDYAAIQLGDYGRPGNYFARQLDRWSKQYRASETTPIIAMDRLIDWLPAHIPPGDETSIVHGDMRLDNMLFHPTEPRVLAVIDWELSTLGHPLGDFAYQLMAWRLEPDIFAGLPASTSPRVAFPTKLPMSPPIAGAPGAPTSRISTITSPTTCSGSPPSCRASPSGRSTAPRRTSTPLTPAPARAASPKPA